MALAIDGSTPAVVTSSTTSTTITTASFTPPAGSLLLVLWSGNSTSGINPAAPTITDNLGTPLTYTLTDWQSRADTPTVNGQAAVWSAVIGSSAAMTVTVTIGVSNSSQRQQALAVMVITGQHATPVGAHGKTGSTSAAAIAQSYTAQASGGQGFIVATDWDAVGTPTAGTSCTDGGSGHIAGQISFAIVRRTSADDSNGASNTINVTLPGTSAHLNWVYAEILPAAGATTAFPPYWEGRRRLLAAPRVARTRMAAPTQIFPTLFVDANQPRRVRGLAPRRGRASLPLPIQAALPPPPLIPSAVRARPKFARAWRGRSAQPTPAQIVTPPPAYVPQGLRARLRSVRLPRGRAVQVVQPQAAVVVSYVPTKARQATARTATARRGRTALPPAPQATPPLFARVKLRMARLIRGRSRSVVPPQVILIAPPYPPLPTRARHAAFAARRHRAAVDAWMAPGVVSCQLPRPAGGNTGRPGSGSTARPTATTMRPGSGVTLRPDTGNTANPC